MDDKENGTFPVVNEGTADVEMSWGRTTNGDALSNERLIGDFPLFLVVGEGCMKSGPYNVELAAAITLLRSLNCRTVRTVDALTPLLLLDNSDD